MIFLSPMCAISITWSSCLSLLKATLCDLRCSHSLGINVPENIYFPPFRTLPFLFWCMLIPSTRNLTSVLREKYPEKISGYFVFFTSVLFLCKTLRNANKVSQTFDISFNAFWTGPMHFGGVYSFSLGLYLMPCLTP